MIAEFCVHPNSSALPFSTGSFEFSTSANTPKQ